MWRDILIIVLIWLMSYAISCLYMWIIISVIQ